MRFVRRAVLSRPFLALVVICALIGLGCQWLAGHFACAWDTSYCAASHAKDGYYAGVLIDPRAHRALVDRRLRMYVESRHDYAITLDTDAAGRYCIIWADERVTPAVRLTTTFDVGLYGIWESAGRRGYPNGCQTTSVTVPWNRADDLLTRWQYRSVLWLGLAALLPLGSSALASAALKLRLRLLGTAATLATVGLFIAVWD